MYHSTHTDRSHTDSRIVIVFRTELDPQQGTRMLCAAVFLKLICTAKPYIRSRAKSGAAANAGVASPCRVNGTSSARILLSHARHKPYEDAALVGPRLHLKGSFQFCGEYAAPE